MVFRISKLKLVVTLAAVLMVDTAVAQRQMEKLGRGLIAMRTNSTQVYLGWRLLGNDPQNISFNLYRSPNGGTPVKLNTTPISASTNYLDTPGSTNLASISYSYTIRPVVGGVEVADTYAHPLSGPAVLPANPVTRQYTPIPIQPTPDGALSVGFCWVGDLDGDGEYDFVIIRNGTRQFLEAYKRNGTLMWRMQMGPNSEDKYNIEPGSSTLGIGHGDNATVYDMDGDGKAEVIVRTANGVVFNNGAVVSAANNDSQFISIVNGETGVEMARDPVPNPYLADGPITGHMGIVYVDGQRPSVILAAKNRRDSAGGDNGFQGLASVWDYRNGVLARRWSYDSDTLNQHAPEGHQIRLGDPDNDGRDEFLDIGYGINDNGLQLFNVPEIVHGDRFHMADIDPDRPGLETYVIQQNNGSGLATAMIESGTGGFIRKWYAAGVVDVGRGLAADIDPAHKGLEMFSTQSGLYNCKGVQIYSQKPFPPEAVWWDGNLSREFLATVGSTAESPAIARFDSGDPSAQSRIYTIYNQTPPGVYWAYGGRPQFWGDIQGDWREEVLVAANDNSELRIYTTTNSAPNRIYTLMHNPQYRIQATTKGYVQASYVDYYLGDGMTPPPPPPMVEADLVWRGGAGATVWDNGVTSSWLENGSPAAFTAGKSVRLDIGADNSTPVALDGILQPEALTVYSPKNQAIDGAYGSLAGTMKLMKSGAGSLTLSGSHSFSGATTVWDGAFILDGGLVSSPVIVWGGTFGGVLTKGTAGGRIGGTGTFGQGVTVGYRGGITPGSGNGNAGTLGFSNGLTAQDGSYFSLDLSNNPAGATANDRIAVSGNLAVSGKVGIVIHALNGSLAPGSYTLVTYTGTLTGSVSNFAVTVPPGTPYTLTAASGAVILTVPVTRSPGSVVWRGTGTSWDLATNPNWLSGGSPDVFVAGDSVTFDGTGAASPTVTLATQLPVAGVTVNTSTDYAFSGTGSISGPGGLTKSGSGTLTVGTTNEYTGPTTITGGVLAIESLGDAGSPGSIGAAGGSAGNLVINGGTLRLTGSQTNTNRSLTLGSSGGTLDVASAGSSMQISGTLGGSGRLTKSGPGTLILANANTYTGSTTISGGTIYLAGAIANSSGLGTGTITFNNGTLTMANVQASETAAWNMIVPAGFSGRLNADGRCSLTGALTGAGVFDYYSPYVRSDLKGNWSAFTGQINLATDADGSEMRVTNTYGFGTAALHIGAESYVYYNITSSSPTLDIGELTGDATTGIGGGPTANRTVTWRVGGRNTDATFSGSIVNGTGPTAITKSGTGIWTLAGASTHTGATTVAAGTLRIAGSTSGSNVTVQGGAVLGGGGTITGNLAVQSGGILEHQAQGAVPLAITGDLTFGTTAIVRPVPGINLTPGTYTLLTYSGTLTGNPGFVWQDSTGSTLVATFDISVAGVVTMNLALPPGVSNLTWTGNIDSVWDSVTANWTTGSAAVPFTSGSNVSFTESGNATAPVTIPLDAEPVGVVVDAAKSYIFAGSGKIIGDGALTKAGSGSLRLTTANTYTGGTFINGGILALGVDSSSSATTVQHPGLGGGNCTSLGTGTVSVSGGGQLRFGGKAGSVSTFTTANPVVFDAGNLVSRDGVQVLTGGVTILGGGANWLTAWSSKNLVINSAFSGNGPLVIDDSSLGGSDSGRGFVRILSAGNPYNGTITINGPSSGYQGGVLQIENNTALANATIVSNNTAVPGVNFAAATPVIGALGGGGNITLPATSLTVGGNGTSSSLTGVLSGPGALIKTGGGSLTLTGANTYLGTTSVIGGRLNVVGSLAGSAAVTVGATASLGGSGTIAGAVSCDGTLSPGTSVGTLSLANGLTLTSGSVLDYELGTVSDLTSVGGNLTLAGTLHVAAAPGFGPGTYTLFTYTGTLTDEAGLQVGSLPPDCEATVNTASPGLVRLVVTSTLSAFELWQIDQFGSTTNPDAAPDADPDGDGTANRIEFLLGLNPKDGGSSFRARGQNLAGAFVLTWPSAAGVGFEIHRSITPAMPWQIIGNVTGTGSTDSFTDHSPPAGNAFYKVVIPE